MSEHVHAHILTSFSYEKEVYSPLAPTVQFTVHYIVHCTVHSTVKCTGHCKVHHMVNCTFHYN